MFDGRVKTPDMKTPLRALVVSPYLDTLQHIEAAFRSEPDIELSLHTDCAVPQYPEAENTSPSVLIVHSEAPSDWLRDLRKRGYTQPALILTSDSANPRIAPVEDDLKPIENVTWGVVRAGGLPGCVSLLLSA